MSYQNTQSTSLSLIQRVKASDESAWLRLTRLYGPLVYHWAKHVGLKEADITDLMQNVYIELARSIGNYHPEKGYFRSWLWGLTRNKLREHFRALPDAQGQGGQSALDLIQQIPDDYRQWDDEETVEYRLLHRALDLIQPDFEPASWQAFYRMTIQGESAREIANDLKMTSIAVRQAKFRILRRLRLELDDPEFFLKKYS